MSDRRDDPLRLWTGNWEPRKGATPPPESEEEERETASRDVGEE